MQILSVKAENFKGLKLVEVEPQKTTTIVGGKNKQVKSSLLDAIAATLGGAKLTPGKPIRDGETEAKCKIKLEGDGARLLPACTVTRTWTQRRDGTIKSELEIITDDDFRAPTPQAILNDVVGPLGFDPERFLRMKPKEQAEVLRKLVGLDFSTLDVERETAYGKRTDVNRSGKEMAARLEAKTHHEDAPEEEVSVADLMTELKRRQAVNQQNEEVRVDLMRSQDLLTVRQELAAAAEVLVEELKSQLQREQERVERSKKHVETTQSDITVKSAAVNNLNDAGEAEIHTQLTGAQAVNRKVRENAERATLEAELGAELKKSAALSIAIKKVDVRKQKMREEAEWPVADLGYDDDGVTLFERPFDQASATEQREAAFGIVAALNPTLKFAMIKDGSLLDDDSLADFSRLAAERGFQLFVERVGEGEECTIVISEGEVV